MVSIARMASFQWLVTKNASDHSTKLIRFQPTIMEENLSGHTKFAIWKMLSHVTFDLKNISTNECLFTATWRIRLRIRISFILVKGLLSCHTPVKKTIVGVRYLRNTEQLWNELSMMSILFFYNIHWLRWMCTQSSEEEEGGEGGGGGNGKRKRNKKKVEDVGELSW